jgi:hypothetical protein
VFSCTDNSGQYRFLITKTREVEGEIAQHGRNLREDEARRPVEEQLRLNLPRLIESELPELTEKIRVKIRRKG